MGRIAAILSLFIATAALAQSALPPTPPGKALAELLDAFNSGDAAQAEAFDRAYRPSDPVAGMTALRAQTGGFELVKVETSDATTLTAILRERAGDRFARLQLSLSDDVEPKLTHFRLDPVAPPAGLGPAAGLCPTRPRCPGAEPPPAAAIRPSATSGVSSTRYRPAG